jgi:serine/threonine-protein kinase
MKRTLLVIAIVASASQAHADPAGAQAEVLFRQGRELMTAGKIAEACAMFAESQKLEAAVTTLLNLAGCREMNGQLATAWGLFLEAERQTRVASDDATHQLHDVAKTRADALEPRVSKLTINVPDKSRVDGLDILREGEHVDAVMWNRALPMDGGTYTITARAPGANDWSTKVTVGVEADTKTVDIPDLRNLSHDLHDKQPPKETPAPLPPPHHASKALPIAVGAGAVVLGGVAVGLELDAESTYNKAKAELTSQARRDSLYNSANTKRFVADGLAIGGVVCAGAAVWLYVRSRHADERTTVVVTPTGVAVVGRF